MLHGDLDVSAIPLRVALNHKEQLAGMFPKIYLSDS